MNETAVTPDISAIDAGKTLVEKYQCARCHDGTGAAEVPRDKHCVRCHHDIGEGKFEAPKEALADWKKNVMHLRFTPSLSGIGRLVKPDWAATYLTRPHDLRPELHPNMPRLAIDMIDARSIVVALAHGAHEPPIPTFEAATGSLQRGRELFRDKTCTKCHTFSGSGIEPPRALPPSRAPNDRALAPDLRFARERLVPENVVAYLIDPKTVKPDAAMPKLDLSLQEATDLATFVMTTPLDKPSTPPAAQTRLAVLDRPVGYDEVATKVLHKICWHCHSQPDYARGDGGPGNTGGFGFEPRKLDLSSYESISAGYLDERGERRSLFSKGPRGLPILLETLLARQSEERELIADVRGMPLGLPSLSPEEIQLIETWIEQGHPR